MNIPQAPVPQADAPISAIHVWLTKNNTIGFACEGKMLSRPQVNMLLETVKQDLIEMIRETEKKKQPSAPAIEIAPAGMQFARNDQG